MAVKKEEFRAYAHQFVDWMADYLENVEDYPVSAQVQPGDIKNKITKSAPLKSEKIEEIFADFKTQIMPGITHWQNPQFFAYFPANSSVPSLLAEMLTATLGVQGMSWATSPAATELEESMMEWLREMLALPEGFSGVIQDTASTATLTSILSAREQKSNFNVNKNGLKENEQQFVLYCSKEAHSSIEKAAKIAGIGKKYIRLIDVDENFALNPKILEQTINADLKLGLTPLYCVAAIGTTGSTAIDPLEKMAEICKKFNVWLHVDAAYAGTALICPEFRYLLKGQENIDSFVFNPHKWMFTNFDCSVYFVKDKGTLIQTFEILPEYLKTKESSLVINYRDWHVQLGRRFRALKLWFVIRSYGVEGLQEKIRFHIKLSDYALAELNKINGIEILAPKPLNVICFRYKNNLQTEEEINLYNEALLKRLNETKKVYLSHTKLNGKYVIRIVLGQTFLEQKHVDFLLKLIKSNIQN